jgi:TRAP-type uncharacterized transport system substrate-binding protein
MPRTREPHRFKLVTALIETFGFSPWLASLVALFLVFLGAAALVWLWLSAPPRSITVLTGPDGSTFQRYANGYREQLAARGVEVQSIATTGSLENLQRLGSSEQGLDLAFVQSTGVKPPAGVMSLGTIAYQPIWVYYRGTTKIARLSELAGKRIGVGTPGSGTHAMAIALLQANGITGAPSTLVERPAESAAADLLAGRLDAIFLMGEAAPLQTLSTLMRTPEVQVYSFTQAEAYVRRLKYLNKIVVPQGAFDLARNLPPEDITLVGPAVELVARKGLNAAVADVLLDAARKVHGTANAISRAGEFPKPVTRDFTLGADAERFYKSGLGLTYRHIDNFWAASLINRALVAIVPLVLLTIPAMRILPIAYRWSVNLRIYRCYRPLLQLEREAQTPLTGARAAELLERLTEIERDVDKLRVPASFAFQFYALREHVDFVRARLQAAVRP